MHSTRPLHQHGLPAVAVSNPPVLAGSAATARRRTDNRYPLKLDKHKPKKNGVSDTLLYSLNASGGITQFSP